jgi:hypothetical protein
LIEKNKEKKGSDMSGLYERQPIKITRLAFIPIEETHDMVHRTNTLQVNGVEMARLSTRLEETRGKLSGMDIANIAPHMNRVSDTHMGVASMVNGWRTRRAMFMLVAETMQGGALQTTYINGFTDHFDPSLSGIPDPNMRMYINNVFVTRTTFTPMTDGTTVTNTNLVTAFNVINGMIEHDVSIMRALRPTDVLSNLTVSNMYGVPVDYDVNKVNGRALVSDPMNQVGNSAVATVLNGVIDGKKITDDMGDEADVLLNANSVVNEFNPMAIPIIDAIAEMEMSLTPTSFTLHSLDIIDPTMVVDTYNRDGNVAADISLYDHNESLNIQEIRKENTIATEVVNSGLSLLMKNQLTDVIFSITNEVGGTTEPIIQPVTCNSLIKGIDLQPLFDRFLTQFSYYVFRAITENGQMGVSLRVELSVITNSRIFVTINNGIEYPVVIPTYASNAFTGILMDEHRYGDSLDKYKSLISIVA